MVAAARSAEELSTLMAESGASDAELLCVPTDVSNLEAMKLLAEQCLAKYGRIDVWINNAGVAAIGQFSEIPLDLHTQVIATNLLGVLYGSHLAIGQFLQQGTGILINIASVLGVFSIPYYASYVASKHGVKGLSDALRQELHLANRTGIHVCTVMPSTTDTEFFNHAANFSGHRLEPMPPVSDEADVIAAIVKLATEPEDDIAPGAVAKAALIAHRLAPGLFEGTLAKQTHHQLMESADAAPATPGNVNVPMGRAATQK